LEWLAVLRLAVLRLAGVWLPVRRWAALLRLVAVLRRPRLRPAVHLTVLDGLPVLRLAGGGGLTEPALVRRRALPRTTVVRPRAPVPVALLGLVLGVVVPTGWKAHGQSITQMAGQTPSSGIYRTRLSVARGRSRSPARRSRRACGAHRWRG
jgi:hypothetical protein